MSSTISAGTIDLSVDVEVFSTPNGGKQELAAPLEAGGWTTTTTCWTCEFTCSGCDESDCAC